MRVFQILKKAGLVYGERLFSEKSFRHRSTKLLCPGVHGLQPALTVSDDGLATLVCGCSRPEILPLKENRFSVEQLARVVSKEVSTIATRLFPGTQWNEWTFSWRHPE